MGRHSRPEELASSSARKPVGLILAIIALLTIVVLLLWWFLRDSGTPEPASPTTSSASASSSASAQADECALIPVAATDGSTSSEVAGILSASGGCNRVEAVDSVSDAVVLIAPEGEDISAQLDEHSLAAQASPQPVANVDGKTLVAHVLQPHGGVGPAQTEAAEKVVSSAAENYQESPATQTESQSPQLAPADTLFLLDTSTAMQSAKDAAAQGIGDAATHLTQQGKQVALWNYSSPLNPGVTEGFRVNIGFSTDGGAIGKSANLLGIGGQPLTREAVAAAVANAADRSRATGQPAHVVLITSGTSDQGNIEAVRQQLADSAVELAIVHVGDQPADQELASVATTTTHANPSDLPQAIAQTSGV
ncbi:VWA domain-containing protein [Corynebacterium tapiri]|uniref:VWA domain-containing protein n=1 Tax=Corynebacterium tapiri TaxID=1448266 RepID=A0A5C4U4I8_9CORY|nr:VWA domain-containing protein [Corynebacterium tapiri]TNL97640.1 VWA domain-containing protein [Corynebacterium tapiri]